MSDIVERLRAAAESVLTEFEEDLTRQQRDYIVDQIARRAGGKMTDIVGRLRVGGDGPCDCEILGEAATEIERLRGMVAVDTGTWQDLWKIERAANERLTAALREIADHKAARKSYIYDLARAALEGK